MRRYLGQLGTFLAPRSVAAADSVLRQFARWLLATTTVTTVATISRDDIEDFKVHLVARPGYGAGRLSASTCRQRMQTLRMFFERIIEWDWPEAPARCYRPRYLNIKRLNCLWTIRHSSARIAGSLIA